MPLAYPWAWASVSVCIADAGGGWGAGQRKGGGVVLDEASSSVPADDLAICQANARSILGNLLLA